MTAEHSPDSQTAAAGRHPEPLALPGWLLALSITVGAGVALAAASLRWVGVGLIVALVLGACALLLRWSR